MWTIIALIHTSKQDEGCWALSVENLVPGLLSSSTVHGHMAKTRRTGRDQCLECNPGFYRDGVICKPFSCETGSANGCISAAKPACGSAVAQSLTGARQTRLNYLISSLAHIGTKARLVARKQREQGTTNAPFLNWILGTRNLFILGPLAEGIESIQGMGWQVHMWLHHRQLHHCFGKFLLAIYFCSWFKHPRADSAKVPSATQAMAWRQPLAVKFSAASQEKSVKPGWISKGKLCMPWHLKCTSFEIANPRHLCFGAEL